MCNVRKEQNNVAFDGMAAAQGANLQTVVNNPIVRTHEVTETLSANFSALSSSTCSVSKTTFTTNVAEDACFYTYDVSLKLNDALPLDNAFGKSCLVRLSAAEIKTLVSMLNQLIAE